MPHLTELARLDPTGWETLLNLGTRRSYEANQSIFLDEQQAELVYVLAEGLVEIYKGASTSNELRLAILNPGDLFGEGAILERTHHSACARAFKPSVVVEIPAVTLLAFLEANPTFATRLFRLLSQQFHDIVADLDADLRLLQMRLMARDAHG